jgi:hypothetical protein
VPISSPHPSAGSAGARGAGPLPPSGEPSRAYILSEDPDLAGGLAAEERRRAADLLHAETIDVCRPRWEPPSCHSCDYGLLVLEGLLARQVRVGKALATELLGPGDILRPWDRPLSSHVIPPRHEWLVLHTSRLAVLDGRITVLIGSWPELSVSFAARLVRHSRSLAYTMAVSHLTRVDDRLLGLLWHLASMWGRVTPTGVTVPFRLTHQVLGEVVGAQRPSVTSAMRSLQERRLVERGEHGGYVLRGDPPEWSRVHSGA